jgi:opacity protein-like surface antigen
MRKTYLLLGSVSAVAMAAAATAAQAQDAIAPGGHTISVEGGGLFAKSVGADKLGQLDPLPDDDVDLNDNIGYRAAISLGTRIDNFWDVRASAAINHQLDATSSITEDGGPGYYRAKTGFDYETLDFEVGYTPELDAGFNVRLFGGVRGMHYTDRQSFGEGDDKVGIAINYKDEFLGAGPRIGAEGSARFGDSMFGISGSVSAAAMYGVSTESLGFEVTGEGPPPPPDDTMDTNKWVYNLEASLGLDAYLSDNATVTIGYRASTTSPVGENIIAPPGLEPETNRFSHGPTLKLTIQAD